MGGIGFWTAVRKAKDVFAIDRTGPTEHDKAAERVQEPETGKDRETPTTAPNGSSINVSVNVGYRDQYWPILLLSVSKKVVLSLMILIPLTALSLLVSWNSHSSIPSCIFYFGVFFVLHRMLSRLHPVFKRESMENYS